MVVLTGIPADGFTDADIRHACRCARRTIFHPTVEARLLIRLADRRGQSLTVLAAETRMSHHAQEYLRRMCVDDPTALGGIAHMAALRDLTANAILTIARKRQL